MISFLPFQHAPTLFWNWDVCVNKVMFSKDKVCSVPACQTSSVHEKRECHWRILKLLCLLKRNLKPRLSRGALVRWLNALLGWNACPPFWTWSLQVGTDVIHVVPFIHSYLFYLDVISYYEVTVTWDNEGTTISRILSRISFSQVQLLQNEMAIIFPLIGWDMFCN